MNRASSVNGRHRQGGLSIRVRTALALVLLAASSSFVHAAVERLVLLRHGQRQELMPTERGRTELIALERLIGGLGVAQRTDTRTGNLTLRYQDREVILYPGKSLASVLGDLRLLSGRIVSEAGDFWVPVDAAPLLLEPLLGFPVRWYEGPRVLAIGAATVPRVDVHTEVSGDRVRVVLKASEPVRFRVTRQAGRVAVFVDEDLLEVEFEQQRLTGGIVERVEYAGGREHVFGVSLGPRFRELKQDASDPRRLTMEFESEPLARADAETPQAAPIVPADEPAIPVIVIDPGHGGQNIGAQGPKGTVEKEITLEIAQKLRASVLANLGYRVFLTRSTDQEVDNDARPAIANNYKADLFVSIHANASRRGGAKGSEVYFLSYQATDDESRRLALAEGAALPLESSGEDSPLSMILWDMAQADHLEESSRLASRIQEELATVTGSKDRGIKQAPFRVLVGAAMPAVLVEVSFISDPEEEQLLKSSAYQWRLASALMRGIARFMVQRQQRLGAAARP